MNDHVVRDCKDPNCYECAEWASDQEQDEWTHTDSEGNKADEIPVDPAFFEELEDNA